MFHLAQVIERAPETFVAETATTLDAIDRLQDAWLALEEEANTPVFFQSFKWTRFVAATRERSGLDLRIVVVRDAGRPVLIWPLSIEHVMAGRIAQDLTEPFGQYSDALIAEGYDAVALLDAAWTEIQRWNVDALVVQRVRADAAISGWISAKGHKVGDTREAPFVDLSPYNDFASYHASIRSKTRKNLRNYRNRLARSGHVTHRLIVDEQEVKELTRLCLTWRSDWLTASGLSSAAFQHPAFQQIIEGLADGDYGAPPLQLMMLALESSCKTCAKNTSPSIDGIVAIQWGFRHGNRYYAFMSARNPEFDAYSPGRLHLEDVIATCASEGISLVDLLVPRVPYKDTWATGSVTVDCYGVANTMRGRLIVDVWHKLARPALKSAVLRLPTSIRRLAFREAARVPSAELQHPAK